MGNNIWRNVINVDSLKIIATLSNFYIENMDEPRITKRRVSAVSFNSTRDYSYCFNYYEYLEEFLGDHKLENGTLSYEVGCDERTNWEIICNCGFYRLYKIVKPGFTSPTYKVYMPTQSLFVSDTNSFRRIRLKFNDYKFIKSRGIRIYINVLIQKYFYYWLSDEYRLFIDSLKLIVNDRVEIEGGDQKLDIPAITEVVEVGQDEVENKDEGENNTEADKIQEESKQDVQAEETVNNNEPVPENN